MIKRNQQVVSLKGWSSPWISRLWALTFETTKLLWSTLVIKRTTSSPWISRLWALTFETTKLASWETDQERPEEKFLRQVRTAQEEPAQVLVAGADQSIGSTRSANATPSESGLWKNTPEVSLCFQVEYIRRYIDKQGGKTRGVFFTAKTLTRASKTSRKQRAPNQGSSIWSTRDIEVPARVQEVWTSAEQEASQSSRQVYTSIRQRQNIESNYLKKSRRQSRTSCCILRLRFVWSARQKNRARHQVRKRHCSAQLQESASRKSPRGRSKQELPKN